MKVNYFNIGKNIQSMKFKRNEAPLGWVREDILLKQLKEDKGFRAKFSREEIKRIKNMGLI